MREWRTVEVDESAVPKGGHDRVDLLGGLRLNVAVMGSAPTGRLDSTMALTEV
jgi:hypothetical protein